METELHTYIKKIWWNIQFSILIAGQKQCHPHIDEYQSEITKKRVKESGEKKNQRNIDVCAHVAMQMICLGITV